jgi:hypothetical protein
MSTAPGAPVGTPHIPRLAADPEELRAALVAVAPHSLETFDAQHAEAERAARRQVSSVPLRRFCEQWAVYVAIERHPDAAMRLRALEARAAETDDLEEARRSVAEIGRILDMACTEAGRPRTARRRRTSSMPPTASASVALSPENEERDQC